MTRLARLSLWLAAACVSLAVLAALAVAWLWRHREPLTALSWPLAEQAASAEAGVTATWFGITTLLFDDGETQILIDGTFTRLHPLAIALMRPVSSDIATINFVMDEYRIDRLAAIVPVHSHFDHALDVGRVANRSTALVMGSESTANIARGAGVPVDQFQILASGERRVFGDFTITLLESRHVPLGIAAAGWPSGVIDEPLEQPARVWSWRSGVSYSILIAHPSGTALVQGSAGVAEGMLAGRAADAVFLSVAGLAGLGAEYAARYWDETVRATGARDVFAVHFDDFTRPFGEVALFPAIVDEVPAAAVWLDALAAEDGITIRRPRFGAPLKLF